MSDDTDPAATGQPTPDNPPDPAPSAPPPGSSPEETPAAPDQQAPVPVAPGRSAAPQAVPIDYAMPSQPKSWLPSPALVKNLGCIFKMLLGFTVLLGVGYFMLMAMNPKARQWALQGNKPGAAGSSRGPTPFKAINQILALPAQALGKTDDVVKANNARAGVVDGMVAEEEAKGKGKGGSSRTVVNPFVGSAGASGAGEGAGSAKSGAKGGAGGTDGAATVQDERAAQAARMMALQEKLAAEQAASGQPAPKADPVRATAIPTKEPEALAPITLPGGIVIRGASPAGAPAPTRAFLYWIVGLNLSGINPPRLLLNGRLVHEGQEIHIPLGIVLARIDPAAKLLHFRDSTGAVVTRSY